MLLWDRNGCIPLDASLHDGDILLLLTPVVALPNTVGSADRATDGNGGRDPFEVLGRSLAQHHPWIRHVPYTAGHGITGTHLGFISLSRAVLFVISGPPNEGQIPQIQYCDLARDISEGRPYVVLACCNARDLGEGIETFQSVIQLAGFSSDQLRSVADILFPPNPTDVDMLAEPEPTPETVTAPRTSPTDWLVEIWDEHRDMSAIHELWSRCLPPHWHLDRLTLQMLLIRDGYAMHYVVRHPSTKQVIGFCATYTIFADSSGEKLLGSLAMILVEPSFRRQGMGTRLHSMGIKQLTKTRGVCRLQFGSTFPRLLYGLSPDCTASDAFALRQGWLLNQNTQGSGQQVHDWILRLEEWPRTVISSTETTFRQCVFEEFDTVLDFVKHVSDGQGQMGWFDQYARLANSFNIRDIVIGIKSTGVVVAAALTYVRNADSQAMEDLPWAQTVGVDVGGVTCLCIGDDDSMVISNRDSIMIRLLDACVEVLQSQGVKHLFLDAIKGGEEGFLSLGFHKWATYRDVWRKV